MNPGNEMIGICGFHSNLSANESETHERKLLLHFLSFPERSDVNEPVKTLRPATHKHELVL